MRNSFLVNIVLLVFVNILIKPAYIFGVEIPVQNFVGNESYGMYFAFLNLAYIFQLLTDFGLQNFTYAELPRVRANVSKMIINGSMLRVIFAVLFAIVMSISGYLLGYWELDAKLFSIIILNVWLISCLQYVRANVSGLGHYFTDSIISVIDKLLMLIVLVLLLYGGSRSGFTIHTFALVQTGSILVAILVGIFLLKNQVRWVKPDWSYMLALTKRSFPYGILIALMFLYTRLDAIMIEKMLPDGLDQAGLYASAYRLYDAVTMIAFLFATLLLPMFTELENDRGARDKLYYGSLNMILAMSMIIAIPVILLRDEIMNGLYDSTTYDSIMTLSFLMWAFVFKSTLFITGTLLTSAKRLRQMTNLFVIGLVVNFLANYWLIPTSGIRGAAWATLITQVLMAGSCIILSHSKNLVLFNSTLYLRMGGYISVLLIAFIYFTRHESYVNWFTSGIFVLVASIFYLFLNFGQVSQLSGRIIHR